MLQIKKAREKQNTRTKTKISFHRENSKHDRYRDPYTERPKVGQIPKQAFTVISLISKSSTKELPNMTQQFLDICGLLEMQMNFNDYGGYLKCQ